MFDNLITSRRDFLRRASCGFGFMALADLCTRAAASETRNPLTAKPPHFPPHAKHVIFLFMAGGPSHVDTFDYKPRLQADDGKTAGGVGNRKLLKSPFKFSQHGENGLWFPETFSNLAQHADDLCVLNSMYTDIPAHAQATIELHTGNFRQLRPSMGAWALYGLGTDNTDLPGFVTINPQGGAAQSGCGFCPLHSRRRRCKAGEFEAEALPTSRIPGCPRSYSGGNWTSWRA